MGIKQILKSLGLGLFFICLISGEVYAQSSTSSNYRIDEYQFGVGADNDLSSQNYRAQGSAGSLGVGSYSSPNYDAEAGLITANQPYLEFVVNASTVDLGLLDTATTATGTGSFYVRTYLSSAYSVKTMSQPPTNESGAVLDGMSSAAAPTTGVEQFGINLVDNSSPNIGSDPVNIPSNSYADGEAAPGYNTPNQFKYVVGDTVARSAKTAGNQATGRTDYTISYVADIAPFTPAGKYDMQHDLVAVATY